MRQVYLYFNTIVTIVFIIVLCISEKWTSLAIFDNTVRAKSELSHEPTQVIPHKDSLTIFMVTNNYYPYTGGVAQGVATYSQELRKQGHKVIIITLDFLGNTTPHEQDVVRLWCPIKFTYKKNPIAIPLRAYKTIEDLVDRYKPDIIHVHHPFLLGAVGLKIAKNHSIPVVFTYWTQYEKYTHYIPLPSSITKPITTLLVSDFCTKVDLTIMLSATLSIPYVKNYVMLPSCISPLFFSNFTYKTPQHRFNLVTVSRFAKEKNIPFLLDAYKRLDPSRYSLTLIGYGSEQENLENYAYKTLNLSTKDVKFVIKPQRQDLVSWYKKADLFLFASFTETQGLVLAEAMSQGTPIVALNAPGSKDIIKHGHNGFLVDSLSEMVNQIHTIAEDINLHKTLQYNAWITAQDYSSTVCTTKLIKLYYNLLKNKLGRVKTKDNKA